MINSALYELMEEIMFSFSENFCHTMKHTNFWKQAVWNVPITILSTGDIRNSETFFFFFLVTVYLFSQCFFSLGKMTTYPWYLTAVFISVLQMMDFLLNILRGDLYCQCLACDHLLNLDMVDRNFQCLHWDDSFHPLR